MRSRRTSCASTRAPAQHGRAQLDLPPASRRGPVRALGRPDRARTSGSRSHSRAGVTSFGRVEGVDACGPDDLEARRSARPGAHQGARRRGTTASSGCCSTPSTPRCAGRSTSATSRGSTTEIQARLDERGVARVDAVDGDADFRYLRLRNPPYSDDEPRRRGGADRPAARGQGWTSSPTSSTRTSPPLRATPNACSSSSAVARGG